MQRSIKHVQGKLKKNEITPCKLPKKADKRIRNQSKIVSTYRYPLNIINGLFLSSLASFSLSVTVRLIFRSLI